MRVILRDRDVVNPLKPESGESKLDAVFDVAISSRSEDLEVFEESDIVQVKSSRPVQVLELR